MVKEHGQDEIDLMEAWAILDELGEAARNLEIAAKNAAALMRRASGEGGSDAGQSGDPRLS